MKRNDAFWCTGSGSLSFDTLVGFVRCKNSYDRENHRINRFHIADPAETIAAVLVRDPADRHGLKILLDSNQSTLSTEQVLTLAVDVKTKSWVIGYARLKLIDTASGRVLVSCSFTYDSRKHAVHPDYEPLTVNDAEHLKRELMQARIQCIDERRTSLPLVRRECSAHLRQLNGKAGNRRRLRKNQEPFKDPSIHVVPG